MADQGTNVHNKNDFISREAEIQFFNDWVDDLDKKINDSVNYPHLRSDYKVCKTQLLDCIHAIKEMPAADVRPVVRARWKAHGDCGVTECPVCRWSIEECVDYNFCPNCGAEMKPDKTAREENNCG